ncbi:hypothetical protein [Heyndrickxia acidicola]|uniref:Uncharacterized protein n=1 Tax=Heyndrickxia acidicola TaxID=209389 RepID=A0ABU6MN38_9BACI|nr:hypothetical protein [Heyndrickxia acidicola]MED1206078.1 hypothetical protein [Heyndrickxia acidicola]
MELIERLKVNSEFLKIKRKIITILLSMEEETSYSTNHLKEDLLMLVDDIEELRYKKE